MWLILQHSKPDDLVIATGESHSVQEFLELTFDRLDLDWRKHVEFDPRLMHPAEVDILQRDATKACTDLGWRYDQCCARWFASAG